MKELSFQETTDILLGCTLLGTGGGGSYADGIELIREDFQLKKPLQLIPLEEIPEDGYVATPYGCGAPPHEDDVLDAKFSRLTVEKETPSVKAFLALEEHLGKKFCAVSSTELGGANTAEAFHIACALGLPVADSDPTGRSVPDLQQTSYNIMGLPIYPLAVATQFGDTVLIPKVADDLRAEDIVRAIAVVSGDLVGVADHPMDGSSFKKSVIPKALSYAGEIGKLLRESQEEKKSGLEISALLAKQFQGKIAFHGKISKTDWSCTGGFNVGDIFLEGVGDYQNDEYKIWMRNENIVGYRNGKLEVSVPDLICMLDETGMPVTNPDWVLGSVVTLLVLPAPEIWTSPRGLELLGPSAFDFDFEYVPYCK